MDVREKQLAGCIDHTLLDATATKEQVEQFCAEAMEYGFHTVCVNSRWLALAAEKLHGSKVAVGGVVSLPLGANSTKLKVAQAKEAVFAGADEIDMVAEGVKTAKSAYHLSRELDVDMPITEEIYRMLYDKKPVRQSMMDLLGRNRRAERESSK